MTESLENSRGVRKLRPLRHLLAYLLPYKTRLIGATLALLLTSAMTLLLGQGVRVVIDAGLVEGSTVFLNRAAIGLVIITLFYAVGIFIRFYLVSWLGERVSADIRQDVFEHIVELQPTYFEENSSGEIASRLTADTTVLQTIIGSSISMALRSSLTAVGGLVMMTITNFKLTILVLLAVPIVVLPLVIFGRRVKHLARASQDSIAELGSRVTEIVQNIKTVQSYTQEDFEKNAFYQRVDSAFDVARQRIVQRAFLMAAVVLLLFLGLTTMMWIGGGDVIRGDMSGGELAAFVFYALLVAMGMATVSEVYGELQRAAGATERLVELLAVEQKMLGPGGNLATVVEDKLLDAPVSESKIVFKDVDFAYPSRPDSLALENISLSVGVGQTVALVGMSGAGKSTMFELLQRFHDPVAGSILVDGLPICDYQPKALRNKMGVVAQQPALFSGDVASNIRYGNPSASDELIKKAAREAFADEFIQALPHQYNSVLGEGGVRLSGGQKQRIAIARAILRDPEILLLDEATSALDSESERHVQNALEKLMRNRTTLIIAHRLSTIYHADLIVLMDQGRIVDSGKHEELSNRSSIYRTLAQHQFNVA